MDSLPRGQLLIPDSLSVHRDGRITGTFGKAVDPYRRTDGLYLVEEFARLNVRQPRKLRRWLLEHGVVWVEPLILGDELPDHEIQTTVAEIEEHQQTVRWLLETLLRLSTTVDHATRGIQRGVAPCCARRATGPSPEPLGPSSGSASWTSIWSIHRA
jgi:hypothetical protein